ncbi:CAP domain-containing protein [Luedemannella helvata]|uniref:CAP domain-containing protein n=1 Tax=Luedemannella helvata TaxID=349315 RepID=UPI0031E01B77
MGWETQRTTALPEVPGPHGAGRHRRRRRLGGLATAGVLLTIGVTGAMLSPVLIGWTGPLVPPAARASAVVPPTGPAPAAPTSAPPTTGPPESPTVKASQLPPSKKNSPYAYAELEDRVFALTNQARAREGCGALRRDGKLVKAARAHSTDMARNRFLEHTGSDRSSPGTRIERAGYSAGSGWAENIAYGYATPEAVMDGWMNSSGHRRNILNCGLKALGVGVARAANGSLYWTQDFGGS